MTMCKFLILLLPAIFSFKLFALNLEDGSKLRILVVFSKSASIKIDDIHLWALNRVNETNTAFENSETQTKLELVGVVNSEYLESESTAVDLERLKGKGDGYLDKIHDWRNFFQADLVHLIVSKDKSSNCGIGYLYSGNPRFEEYAFSASVADPSCQYTFTHEIGHNLGAAHGNPDENPNENPRESFSFGRGFCDASAGGKRGISSIMHYNSRCRHPETNLPSIRQLLFSNPEKLVDSVPFGTEERNNARLLDKTRHAASNWRSTPDNIVIAHGEVLKHTGLLADPWARSFAFPKFNKIAVGPDGEFWGISTKNEIYRSPNGSTWGLPISGSLVDIDVSPDGSVYGISTTCAQTGCVPVKLVGRQWMPLPGYLTTIAGGMGDSVWGINRKGEIFFSEDISKGWKQMPGLLRYISVGRDGSVYGISVTPVPEGGYIPVKWEGYWRSLEGGLVKIEGGLEGRIYGIKSNHELVTSKDGVGWEFMNVIDLPGFENIDSFVGLGGFGLPLLGSDFSVGGFQSSGAE